MLSACFFILYVDRQNGQIWSKNEQQVLKVQVGDPGISQEIPPFQQATVCSKTEVWTGVKKRLISVHKNDVLGHCFVHRG